MPTYQETISSLYQYKSGNYSTKCSEQLCHFFNQPQKSYPTIHVGGTNGKGTVCTKLAKTVEYAGYRVGIFTSPHISCFRERIQINGEYISESEIIELALKVKEAAGQLSLQPSFFEINTLIAFLYFQQQSVDLAVVEVGLGGRLDSTNVLDPLFTVITSISLDHTQILGNTVEKIAAEKAGIVKADRPTIIGPSVPKQAVAHCAEVYQIETPDPHSIAMKGVELIRKHYNIPEEAITKGLRCVPTCRFEKHKNGTVILDVAHNPASLQYLFQQLEEGPYRIVFGLCRTKEAKECLSIVEKHALGLHFITSSNGRCYSVQELIVFSDFIDPNKISVQNSTDEAIQNAFDLAERNNEKVLVCGSFFIMRDVLKKLNANIPFDPIDLNERI